jgi:small nuclear ribonucleoprotein (snRNP)-like protein
MATPNKFNKGDKVTVTRRNGDTLTGTISGWDYNVCTFEVEYDVDYLKDGKIFTLICVPQTAITLN